MTDIQSISDAKGNPVGVIVPIEIWHEIESRKETAYLTKSETMKKRLLEVKGRGETDRNFWLLTSEDSLNEIWNNEEDEIYAETPRFIKWRIEIERGRFIFGTRPKREIRLKILVNKLYYGDNLDILRKFVRDETVDLC